MFAACKQTTNSTQTTEAANEVKQAIEFNEPAPGKLKWISNAGWEAIGTFDRWKFESVDVPDNDFSRVKAEILVDLMSVKHEKKGLENHLKEDDYLGAVSDNVARISIDGATTNDRGGFNANTILTLKGVTKEVPVSFRVMKSMPARVVGEGMLMREDFGVGDDEGVAKEVKIEFNFTMPRE